MLFYLVPEFRNVWASESTIARLELVILQSYACLEPIRQDILLVAFRSPEFVVPLSRRPYQLTIEMAK
jgi:hypothetical protein